MRWRLLMALAVVLISIGGCTSGGGDGPVLTGLRVDQPRQRHIGVYFPGPAAGASAEQIIRGFLRAGAASDGDYDVARQYLSTEAAGRWSPDAEVVIFGTEGELSITMLAGGAARLSVPLVATISGGGKYQTAAPGTQRTIDVGLSFVDKQWRISSLPEDFGRWIRSTDLRRLFAPYAVHYVADDRRALVPDLRWFPLDRLSTRLARAQLEPVPEDLVGVAHSAVPADCRLLADAVAVQGSIATVNLSVGPGLDQRVREDFWAQFVATLQQDASISGLLLQVDGVSLDLAGVTLPLSSIKPLGYQEEETTRALSIVVRQGPRIAVRHPGGDGIPGKGGDPIFPALPAAYRSLAVSSDGQEIAALGPAPGGISRWRGGSRYDTGRFGSALSPPAYDHRGFLWVGGVGEGANAAVRLWCISTAADPADPDTSAAQPVLAAWLVGRRVTGVRVSPDGERLVVLSTDPTGRAPHVDLAGIVRDETGLPIRLASPRRLGIEVAAPQGLAWVGSSTIATIGAVGAGPRGPVLMSLDGTLVALTPAPTAVQVASAGGERDLMLVTSKGQLLARSGPQWVSVGTATEVAIVGQ